MHATRIFATLFVVAIVLAPSQADGYLINKDVKQTFIDPQDNYEVVLAGDWRNVNPANAINPFVNGSVQKSYDGTDTTISFSGQAIPQGSTEWHFGFGYGMEASSGLIKAEYWTHGATVSATPAASASYAYDNATHVMTVTISNDTEDAVFIPDSFFDIYAAPQPLADMNRTVMPPGSGSPTGITPITLLPGQSQPFNIANVNPTDAVVVYLDVQFALPPSGGYADHVGIWTQAHGADFASGIPTVSEWGLVILTLLLLTAGTILFAKRRRPVIV